MPQVQANACTLLANLLSESVAEREKAAGAGATSLVAAALQAHTDSAEAAMPRSSREMGGASVGLSASGQKRGS